MEHEGSFRLTRLSLPACLITNASGRIWRMWKISASDGESWPSIVAVDFLGQISIAACSLFFHDPARLLHIGLTLTKRALLDHSYMPYEFMLKLWFPDCVASDFPVFHRAVTFMFDSNVHPTVDGVWIDGRPLCDFGHTQDELRKAGFTHACAVALPGVGSYEPGALPPLPGRRTSGFRSPLGTPRLSNPSTPLRR